MEDWSLKQRLARAIGAARSIVADSQAFRRDARDFVSDPKRRRHEDAFDEALLQKLKRDAGERKR